MYFRLQDRNEPQAAYFCQVPQCTESTKTLTVCDDRMCDCLLRLTVTYYTFSCLGYDALTSENTGVVNYRQTNLTTCCAHKRSHFNHTAFHHERIAELDEIPKIKRANRTIIIIIILRK